jgi:hypothetical protein
MGAHWGSVIGDILLEIFVPFVAEYRHIPPLLGQVWQALRDLFAGRFSSSLDHALAAARELSALLGAKFAQFSIAAFIVGSVIGTPIVGEAAMLAVGLGLLAADAAINVASILKAWSNLSSPGRKVPQQEEDYNVIADSTVSMGVTLALILIAAVGQKLGRALLRRFPRVAGALEAVRQRVRTRVGATGVARDFEAWRARLRERLGLPNERLPGGVVDQPVPETVAPPAADYPGRSGMTPLEQRAFDRFIRDKQVAGELTPPFEARMKGMTTDQLRRLAWKYIAAQPDVEIHQGKAAEATATNASDPLRPTFVNNQPEGGNVTSHWNRARPNEVPEGQRIAARTGEDVHLFGDQYRGIDGTVGEPPRPLQIKAPTAAKGPAEVYANAAEARANAQAHNFRGVEVWIFADGQSVKDVAAAFAEQRAPVGKPDTPKMRIGELVDGVYVRRIVVVCPDGVYTPVPTPRVPPAVHPRRDGDTDEAPSSTRAPVPAGAHTP